MVAVATGAQLAVAAKEVEGLAVVVSAEAASAVAAPAAEGSEAVGMEEEAQEMAGTAVAALALAARVSATEAVAHLVEAPEGGPLAALAAVEYRVPNRPQTTSCGPRQRPNLNTR